MNRKPAGTLVFVLFALASSGPSALAQEIYRWVDANGTVHFSDTAPAADREQFSTVTVEDKRPSDFDPEADIYDVAGQAERMQALREEREAQRAARREQQQNAARQQPAAEPQPRYVYPYGFPHLRPPMRPPIKPPMRPRPPQPELYDTSTLQPPGQRRDPTRP